jgi:hypothetical protein
MVLRPLVPIIDYAIRYDYISQELCINRNRPELRCNGKCYVAKEISKNTENNTKTENTKSIGIYIYFFLTGHIFSFQDSFSKTEKKNIIQYRSILYFFDIHNSIFHPPLI